MKSNICLFSISVVLTSLVLPPTEGRAGDSGDKPLVFAAAQTIKPKQTNACRARYRDCMKLNQIPSFECQYIYTDCMNRIY